jgi:hypothetical protein
MSAPRRSAPIVVLTSFIAVACTSAPVPSSTIPSTTEATASEPAPPTGSPSAEATASPAPSPSQPSGPSAFEVDWTVDFVALAPGDWTTEVNETLAGTTTGDTLWLGAGQRYLALTRTGPDTVQSWLDQLAGTEQLDATEPVEVTVGGISAVRVDLVVSDQASEARCVNVGRCYTLFQDESGYWPIVEGRPTALWLLEVEGDTLAIATDSREDSFAGWVATVEEVLATIEWQ